MRSSSRCRIGVLLALAAVLAGWASPSQAQGREVLRYRWRLQGLLGHIAGLFFPNEGEGALSTESLANGHVSSELVITSNEAKQDEYWRYGAELDPATGGTLRAWSSYQFRGKTRSKDRPITKERVIDIASAIHQLRQSPPVAAKRMRIWSDGDIYAVEVAPGQVGSAQLDGRAVGTRRYVVRGVEEPGQDAWNGRLELLLADDPAATPLEILVKVSLASVRLRLVDAAAAN